ncbi:MAG: YitT family protein [Clostridia bacterium]|nr:YitT family protein [Clostridia bacterium]
MSKPNIRITKESLYQYAVITLGALVLALGQLVFIKPLHIPLGGVSGVALVVNYLWKLPIGLVSIVLNLPLFVLGWRTMGREFFYKTVYATVVNSIFLDILDPILPAFPVEMLLAALYGGIVMGAGYGLLFRAGGTSGGIDIVSKWLNGKKDIPVGTTNFIINIFVIIGSAAIYGNPDSALYALVTSYVSSVVIDKMVYGMDAQKSALIITRKPVEVSRGIMEQLHRGVTAMEGVGMYTGDKRTVLLCAVRRHETGTLKRIILQEDAHAFMLISNTNEVFGTNFKRLGQ